MEGIMSASAASDGDGIAISEENSALRKNPTLYAMDVDPDAEGGATPAATRESNDAIPSDGTSWKGALRKSDSGLHRLAQPPEVLAPAGGWAQAKAAVANGADAVYFGVRDSFNARVRAENFAIAELPELMKYLHAHGVKGFCAVNVLIFDEELDEAERLLRSLAAAPVDAIIVQDPAVVLLARRATPSLAVHGSTQMSVTSAEGVDWAAAQGCERVVLGRELSVREIAAVTSKSETEVEVFVHGALCVSYSGQCFSSESWGGRSANRGQCAQACRMPYGLLVNGSLSNLGDLHYLLSPQDLMALEQVPELMEAGVNSFKIEGRLKGPEYVALATAAYREAVDKAWNAQRPDRSGLDGGALEAERLKTLLQPLRQVFARGQDEDHGGLTPGFLQGVQHQRLVRGRSPGHRGVLVGKVVQVKKGEVLVELVQGVKKGDGVAFDGGRRGLHDEKEEGGSIYAVIDPRSGAEFEAADEPSLAGRTVALRFARDALTFHRIRVGNLVWRSRDAALEVSMRSMLKQQTNGHLATPLRGQHGGDGRSDPRLTTCRAAGGLGELLTIELSSADGLVGRGQSLAPFEPARKAPLSSSALRNAIGTLSDSGLVLGQVREEFMGEDAEGGEIGTSLDELAEQGQGLFLPAREVKSARRAALDALEKARAARTKASTIISDERALPSLIEEGRLVQLAGTSTASSDGDSISPEISVLCRTPQQADAASQIPWLKEITLDFLEVHGLQAAVERVRSSGKRVCVATPRVLKPNEERLWRFYLRLGADALLVRSTGLLRTLTQLRDGVAEPTADAAVAAAIASDELRVPELRGDASLNVANVLSASLLLSCGLARLTPGHDLSGKQLAALAKGLVPEQAARLEVVMHQHLPVFHTEHCVFCRFLSEGNSYKDCGHPCEQNTVHLRDSSGQDHLVLADMGCRNTVFSAQAQSALQFVPRLIDAGYRFFRIELVDEPADQVSSLLEGYARALADPSQCRDVWAMLKAVPDANGNAQGVTLGSLRSKAEMQRSEMKPTKASGLESMQSMYE